MIGDWSISLSPSMRRRLRSRLPASPPSPAPPATYAHLCNHGTDRQDTHSPRQHTIISSTSSPSNSSPRSRWAHASSAGPYSLYPGWRSTYTLNLLLCPIISPTLFPTPCRPFFTTPSLPPQPPPQKSSPPPIAQSLTQIAPNKLSGVLLQRGGADSARLEPGWRLRPVSWFRICDLLTYSYIRLIADPYIRPIADPYI